MAQSQPSRRADVATRTTEDEPSVGAESVLDAARRTFDALAAAGAGSWSLDEPGPLRPLLEAALDAERRAQQAAGRAQAAENLARTDPLTQVLNGHGWAQAVDSVETTGPAANQTAVIVVDVDDLKTINDTHGHLAGDLVLREVAQVLTATTRPEDTVARIGGDEFVVVLQEVAPDDVTSTSARLRDALAAHGISASIGHAMAEPGEPFRATFRRADQSMYDTKRRRKQAALSLPDGAGNTR